MKFLTPRCDSIYVISLSQLGIIATSEVEVAYFK